MRLRAVLIPVFKPAVAFTGISSRGLVCPGAVKALNNLVLNMQATLEDDDFLAGPAYSLADAAVTPYANRLFDLGLLGLWAMEAPRVFAWFSAIRDRGNFVSAITNYITGADRAAYRDMEANTPMRVKEILDD